jgi:hypothetical protein
MAQQAMGLSAASGAVRSEVLSELGSSDDLSRAFYEDAVKLSQHSSSPPARAR